MTTYIVKAGDSLSSIAMRLLGNTLLYTEIARVNNIANADLIFPGQVLQIPDSISLPPSGSSSTVAASSGAMDPAAKAQGTGLDVKAQPEASTGKWVTYGGILLGAGVLAWWMAKKAKKKKAVAKK